ncbi:MAG: TonB-dependent receptor [Acidobacteriota bacterium]
MKKRSRRKSLFDLTIKRPVCLLLTVLLLAATIPAQTGTSSVRGSVLDQQGKAVAGATVTLRSAETNFTRTTTSQENGGYVFDLVPPGTYRIETEAAGFKKSVIEAVKALVDKPTNVDIGLEIGNITEAVTISAGSAEIFLNKQDATIGNNFVSQQITQLPLESRNIVQLLSLQPGVAPDGSVTGSRADQGNVTLDGVDVNEQQGAAAFESVLRVSTDSVEEFRVTTTNPNATQGRSSGAQVALVTKSGTNEFHGSFYEFHRNTATSANDFFNNRNGIPTPKLLRNLFGATLGGPIKKDKAFFFYSFEGRRDSSEQTALRTVPLASLGRGEVRFPNTSGGVTTLTRTNLNQLFPAVGTNSAAIALLANAASKYPANDDTTGDGFNTGGFRFNAKTPVELEAHTLKIDYNMNSAHSFFVRANYQQDVFGFAPQFPDTPAPQLWSHPTGIAAGHTWTIGNNLVNSFRYGLTRLAFTSLGDSSSNATTFRFVFSPLAFSRTTSRTTPVHNFIDDASYVRDNHTYQFGTNIRVIRNTRGSTSNSFDFATINPSFYDQSGGVLTNPITGIASGFRAGVQAAVASVIGRFSQYNANFNFDRDGGILPVGQSVDRTFATEEYDLYVQDSWKLKQNLTITYGLRYGLSRPVYEANGFQVKPTTSLGDYFEQRKASALNGVPFNDLIEVDLAGPANGGEPFYKFDKNNFQPRVSVAWSPNFNSGFLKKIFGGNDDSVFRGGFAITHDNFGQQLAVQFDLNNTLGFSSSQVISANTYNVTTRPAPLFTGIGQDVRSLPGISTPAKLTFPLQTPADEAQRIESSLDDTIITPVNYSWNFSYGRKLPGGLFVEAAYIGRSARNLLATRDIMALNNLVDPKSGLDWYTAAGMLHDLRAQNTPLNKVPKIAYFENLFPNLGDNFWGDPTVSSTQAVYGIVAREDFFGFDFFNVLDWTFVQLLIDDLGVSPNMFFHPQYAALSTFSTVAASDYHAGTLTVRERYKDSLTFDFNYTFSKSIDDVSGLQTSGAYGSAFILNPLRPKDNRAVSDFDIRHIINANGVYQLPFGKGRKFLGSSNSVVDAFLGGWQVSGIFRWNGGLPVQTPFDAQQWATNWNVQSNGVRVVPIESSPTRGGKLAPKLFANPEAAYKAFRNARPGETGDRNVLRIPAYIALDMGLGKSFNMPWENHKLQFRWEVFNVTNTQRLTVVNFSRTTFGLDIDPDLTAPPPTWANLDTVQGTPRVMQFGLRYTF